MSSSEEDEVGPIAKRARGRPRGTGRGRVQQRTPSAIAKPTLVNQHADDIKNLLQEGHHSIAIADILRAKNRLPEGSITPKQVSDWITYQRKNGYLPTPAVSGDKMSASWSDNCMFLCIFINLT